MRQRVTITDPASALGRRVLVRHELHGETHHATDVLGVLESAGARHLSVRTKAGELVSVNLADVIALKIIPPQTVTRRDVRDLEAAALQGWQALETAMVGGWLLRASDGFTGRANSCMPLDDPGLPLPEAVGAVERWYADRGLPARFQVPLPLGRSLEPVLDSRGWEPSYNETLVMTADVAQLLSAPERTGLPDVVVTDHPDAAWLAGYHYRGTELPALAIDVLTKGDNLGFASVDEAGSRVAIARGAVTEAPSGRRWLGVTAVEVAPSARRRGLASHVMRGLTTWAAGLDADGIFVQVAAENAPAIATYERLDFLEHHRYHYRQTDHR